jgi:membrane protein
MQQCLRDYVREGGAGCGMPDGRTPTPAVRREASMTVGVDMSEQPTRPSPLVRFRSRHAWLDHLVRAGERYTETHGNHYAAAITYFSLLALVPLLMVGFAAVTLVLVSNPELLAQLKAEIGRALPAGAWTRPWAL